GCTWPPDHWLILGNRADVRSQGSTTKSFEQVFSNPIGKQLGDIAMADHDPIERANTQVFLQKITFATVRDILALDVAERQRGYVAPNCVSIAEAHFNRGAWFRAVYSDETPVGFIMLLDPSVPGAVSQ